MSKKRKKKKKKRSAPVQAKRDWHWNEVVRGYMKEAIDAEIKVRRLFKEGMYQ